jgi:hypothetical protein
MTMKSIATSRGLASILTRPSAQVFSNRHGCRRLTNGLAVFPAAVFALRDAHKERPFVGWVRETYRSHRRHEPGSASMAMAS